MRIHKNRISQELLHRRAQSCMLQRHTYNKMCKPTMRCTTPWHTFSTSHECTLISADLHTKRHTHTQRSRTTEGPTDRPADWHAQKHSAHHASAGQRLGDATTYRVPRPTCTVDTMHKVMPWLSWTRETGLMSPPFGPRSFGVRVRRHSPRVKHLQMPVDDGMRHWVDEHMPGCAQLELVLF